MNQQRKERWRRWGGDTIYFTEARGVFSGKIRVEFEFRHGDLLHASVVGAGYSIPSDGVSVTHLRENSILRGDE